MSSRISTIVIDSDLRDRFNISKTLPVALQGLEARVFARELDPETGELSYVVQFQRKIGHSVKIQAPQERPQATHRRADHHAQRDLTKA